MSKQELNVRWTTTGQGPSTVLIHGFATTSATWNALIGSLPVGKTYHIADLPGHGSSPRSVPSAISIEWMVDCIVDFTLALGQPQMAFVGHSLGAMLALQTTKKILETRQIDITSMVLIAPPAYPQPPPKIVRFFGNETVARLVTSLLPARWLTQLALREVFNDHGKIPAFLIEEYASALSVPEGVTALSRVAQALMRELRCPVSADYSGISVPTLLIWGDSDALVPVSTGVALERQLRCARLSIVPHCGHAPQEECPQETAQIITDFIE